MPPTLPDATLARLMPPVFVGLWSTGFIVARLVAPHTDPLTFLSLRFACAALVLVGAALLVRAPWPRDARGWRDAAVAGALLHGAYTGCVFWAVKHGLPAGMAALIAGLQPLLTAALAGPVLRERVSPTRWAGIVTGFAGAALVVGPKLGGQDGVAPVVLAVGLLGTASITAGTLWQKRTGAGVDLRTGTAIQYLGALGAALPVALLTESGRIDGAPDFWIGLAWAVLVLSIGAVALLLLLIRRGAVAGVAALMYLVPPVAALLGWVLFDETLNAVQVAGMAVAALGVAVATRGG